MYQKLTLSNAQKEYMNDLWDGDELCPNCGYETSFESFNPMETDFIECKDCGKKIRPCSYVILLCVEYMKLVKNLYWHRYCIIMMNGMKKSMVNIQANKSQILRYEKIKIE